MQQADEATDKCTVKVDCVFAATVNWCLLLPASWYCTGHLPSPPCCYSHILATDGSPSANVPVLNEVYRGQAHWCGALTYCLDNSVSATFVRDLHAVYRKMP